jgi:hypothetical protein
MEPAQRTWQSSLPGALRAYKWRPAEPGAKQAASSRLPRQLVPPLDVKWAIKATRRSQATTDGGTASLLGTARRAPEALVVAASPRAAPDARSPRGQAQQQQQRHPPMLSAVWPRQELLGAAVTAMSTRQSGPRGAAGATATTAAAVEAATSGAFPSLLFERGTTQPRSLLHEITIGAGSVPRPLQEATLSSYTGAARLYACAGLAGMSS